MQAIFSDDSDDEGEDPNFKKVENQEKKAEVANTALSRLIAGDFLESLGKELGLEVPPDVPYPRQKSRNAAPQEESVSEHARTDILKGENNSKMSLNHGLPSDQDTVYEGGPSKGDAIYANILEIGSIKAKETSIYDSKSSKSNGESCKDDMKIKAPLTRCRGDSSGSSSEEEGNRKHSDKFNREKHEEYRKIKTPSTHQRDYSSSSSSEEERSRKRSRHHRRRRRDAGSDSSSDDERDRHSSRSKERKKGSSREKSSGSRKHSKHHKHRRHESPSRSSHYSTEKDNAHSRKEKKRRE